MMTVNSAVLNSQGHHFKQDSVCSTFCSSVRYSISEDSNKFPPIVACVYSNPDNISL